jgi:hypothetical protein
MNMQNRRAVLSSLVAGGVVATMTVPAVAGADPILALIETHKKLRAEWQALYDQLDAAEFDAAEEHGRRPIELIQWCDYHIGAGEIEIRRQALLEAGELDPATVEEEYLDAKARYKAKVEAGLAWDELTGLATLRQDVDRRVTSERQYARRLAHTKPATPAGAAALLQHLLDDDLSTDGDYWHMTALRSVVASLNGMVAGGAVMKAGTAGRT